VAAAVAAIGVSPPRLPHLDYLLDLLGVAVFAVSGALAGARRGLDLFGIAVLAAVALTLLGQSYLPNLQTALLVADAFGLGLFALSGAQIAEADRHAWIVVVLMGTMTSSARHRLRVAVAGVRSVHRLAKRRCLTLAPSTQPLRATAAATASCSAFMPKEISCTTPSRKKVGVARI
jgi:hypothetical protein